MLVVSECAPGSHATVKLLRNGHAQTITVTLGELPADAMQNQNDQNEFQFRQQPGQGRARWRDGGGFEFSKCGRNLKIPDSIQGAIVTDVDQDSNSAEAGLQRGDVIVEINRQPVNDADDAVNLRTRAKGDQILLKIWRRDGNFAGTRYLSVDNTKTNAK